GLKSADIGEWRADALIPEFETLARQGSRHLPADAAAESAGTPIAFRDGSGHVRKLSTSVYTLPEGDDSTRIVVAHPPSIPRPMLVRPSIAELKQVALDSLPDEVAILDRDGQILICNKAWSGLVATRRMNPAVRTLMALGFYAAAIEAAHKTESGSLAIYCEALANCFTGQLNSFTQEYEHPDSSGWTRTRVLPCADGIDGLVITRVDISAEKMLLAKLQADRRLLDETLSVAAIGVFEVDLQNGQARATPASFARFGINAPDGEIPLSEWLDRICPDDRDAVADRFSRYQNGETEFPGLEYRVRRGTNDWYWLRSEALGVGFGPVGSRKMRGVIRDITEQKLAEAATRAALDRLDLATQISHLGIWDLDVPSNQLYWNQWMTEIYGADLSGAREPGKFQSLVHPDDRERLDAERVSAWGAGRDLTSRYRVLRPDGSIRWIEARTVTIRDSAGQVIRVLGTSEDRTEHIRQAEQQQHRRHMESIGLLAAGVAHEINTPAQYISSNLQFIGEGLQQISSILTRWQTSKQLTNDDISEDMHKADIDYLLEEVPGAVQLSLDGITRISDIVQNLSDLAMPQSDRSPVDLNTLIEHSLMTLQERWSRLAELQLELAPDLPVVRLSQAGFSQALAHLITNAVEAIEARIRGAAGGRGRIRIASRCDTDEAEVSVTDNGCGMTPAVQARAFEPFFSSKPAGGGAGNGLAHVHAFVVQHGGSIRVESEPGAGCRITIRLPFSAPADASVH
ncbi:MAG: PAS domain-containing protein, partial [Gammaproteobacteria bacterium]|nr:PAS domain-containing protein [Gammaproteobacteria bacterium]